MLLLHATKHLSIGQFELLDLLLLFEHLLLNKDVLTRCEHIYWLLGLCLACCTAAWILSRTDNCPSG